MFSLVTCDYIHFFLKSETQLTYSVTATKLTLMVHHHKLECLVNFFCIAVVKVKVTMITSVMYFLNH